MGTLFASFENFSNTAEALVIAFKDRTGTGQEIWRTSIFGTFPTIFDIKGLALGNSGLYIMFGSGGAFNDDLGRILVLNPNTGSIVDELFIGPTDAYVPVSLAITRGSVGADTADTLWVGVFHTAGSTIRKINGDNGSVLAEFPLASAPSRMSMAFSGDHLLYAAQTTTWTIKRISLTGAAMSDLYTETGAPGSLHALAATPDGGALVGAIGQWRWVGSDGVVKRTYLAGSPGDIIAPFGTIIPHPGVPATGGYYYTSMAGGSGHNQKIWRVPLDLTTTIPSDVTEADVFAQPEPLIFDPASGNLWLIDYIVQTAEDLPLRWRQRDDCLQPGTARGCMCFSFPSGIICIPPFWIRITSSVQFGGNVGPRNTYY